MKRSPYLLALLLGPLISTAVRAQCACDHTIEVGTDVVDGGADLGVGPGDVVCVSGGDRPFLRLSNFVGTAAEPIVIQNCGGAVNIDNDDRGYGLTVDASSFFRITGTGDESVELGFRVRAAARMPWRASGVAVGGLSTDYELDHFEIYDTGFAGFTLKTDPSCERGSLDSFVQKNTRVHDNYIHDTGGEGIYFGSTGYPTRTYNCDGSDVELAPHTHEGVWIHDNRIEDTGWDGMQVGVSPKDCFVYRNRISRVGLEMVQYQMQGIQVGGASECEVFDNFVAHGPASGIIVLDGANSRVFNNVIYDVEQGIYFNDRGTQAVSGASYLIAHNTVVGVQTRGIGMFGSLSSDNQVLNNLVVAAGESAFSIGNEVDVTQAGNIELSAVADALFSSDATEDFSLQEGSPAVDAGVSIEGLALEHDHVGAERDDQPDVGAFEFGAEPPATGGTGPNPPGTGGSSSGSGGAGALGSGAASSSGGSGGSNASAGAAAGADGGSSSNASSGGSDDGGCGCRMPARESGSASSLLLIALFGLGRRRRRARLS